MIISISKTKRTLISLSHCRLNESITLLSRDASVVGTEVVPGSAELVVAACRTIRIVSQRQ